MTRIIVLAAVVALAITVAVPLSAQQAQDPGIRDVTRTFAITNARVVQAPGQELARATVVIRDGLIVAVGPDARVPFDAQIIEGDTLVVYAGFIDALGSAGVDTPAVDTSERIADPDDPPRDRAGIVPDRLARHHLDPGARAVEKMRAAGFTAGHVAPLNGMLPGQGSVVLFGGDRPEQMVLRPDVSVIAQFRGASGAYPSTPMAIAAKLTELLLQTVQTGVQATTYAADPTGRRRPTYDPVSEALAPVAQRQRPVFFVTRSPQEAFRALRLARELEFDVVLAGLPESSLLLDRLRDDGVRVLAPIELPEPVERDTVLLPIDPEHDLAQHLAGEVFITEHRTRSYLDVEDERRVLHERRLISVGLAERNALTLQEAGIAFAFATLGEDDDLRKNLRRMVEAGLPREQMLAALTTAPAELLGLSGSLGTVEAGRIANLVVTNGDYFDEDTRVRYVFVDGRRFELEAAPPEADPDAEVTVLGSWDFTLVLPEAEGAFSGQLTFSGAEDDISGTMNLGDLGIFPLDRVVLTGNRLTFAIPGTPLGTIEVAGTITGRTYDAQLQAPGQQALRLTATRRPN